MQISCRTTTHLLVVQLYNLIKKRLDEDVFYEVVNFWSDLISVG